MKRARKSGILLHPTSLPGAGGIGSLGRESFRFVDFLRDAGQTIWQVLPLGPPGCGSSPYSCFSAFAGNPLLIDIPALVAEGDLSSVEYPVSARADRVDFDVVEKWKLPLLRQAAERFFSGGAGARLQDFHQFCEDAFWLHDFALFMALKDSQGGRGWNEWPEDIRSRTYPAIEHYSSQLGKAIGEHKYLQWQFFRQWQAVKDYANNSGVEIFGDIPIFVAYDSADVWANPHLFRLDEKGSPVVVAGVPPDYFSSTGQLWGNPHYDWDALASHGYSWWIERVRCSLALYDILRIDHFRGFAQYWEVPAGESTAMNGQWTDGPGKHFFQALGGALGKLPIVAEDLGIITPDVEELRDTFNLPGMKILQFAFDSGPDNPYLPHNHIPVSIVYTGTHDNDTTVGWFMSQNEQQKQRILTYINTTGDDIAWEMIRVALASVAERAVVPLQDVLGLGTESKMNKPGTGDGNWSWRFQTGELTPEHAQRLCELTVLFGRCRKSGN